MATPDGQPGPAGPPPSGSESDAADDAFPRLHRQLRALARQFLKQERGNHTLQATALVHEAWLRMRDAGDALAGDQGRFFRAAAVTMRRILIEHARRRARQKRGGGAVCLGLDGLELPVSGDLADVLTLEEAIRRMHEADPALAELVRLRFYAGLSVDETALALGVSRRTVLRDWAFARAWLEEQLDPDNA